MAKLQFIQSVATALSDAQGYEYEIVVVSVDDIILDAFASRLLLYSIVGELSESLCGDWRSEHRSYEFFPDGTGLMHTTITEYIVWMVYGDYLYVNAPEENAEWRYELTRGEQNFFHEGFHSAVRFTKYLQLEVIQTASHEIEEGWIILVCPWFRISVPQTWWGHDLLYAPSAPGRAEVFGEGVGGAITMHLYDSPIADPYTVINEYPSRESFQFDDGHIGYMLERPGGITWFRLDSVGIGLSHGGNRSLFTDNEEVLLRIARSLHVHSDYGYCDDC